MVGYEKENNSASDITKRAESISGLVAITCSSDSWRDS